MSPSTITNSDSKSNFGNGSESPTPPSCAEMPLPPPTINCLLLGDVSAEKTNLVRAYLEQHFPEQHVPCVFFEHTVNTAIEGMPITLKIWDLTGQECFDKLRQLAYKQIGFDILLVCFSIVDPDSVESVRTLWVPEIKWNCPNRPFFLVGTHSDLRTDKKTYEQLELVGKMPVTRLMGQKLARQLRAQKYFECSATRKQGLKEIFDEAIATATLKFRHRRGSGQSKKESCSIQ